MRPRRGQPAKYTGEPQQLAARIADLELRIQLLEARLRELHAVSRKEREGAPVLEQVKAARAARRQRPRPRCPGCLLELPPRRRGATCVWCGFELEVVTSRAFK